jgi:endo-1,4-beta-D-glucanase Y
LLRHPIAALVLAGASIAGAATAYPFPYQADYPYGTRATTITSAQVQSVYSSWLTNYYIESGDKARIGWYDPAAPAQGCSTDAGDCTVSEGIGYAMLIMVYMDNSTNSTQAKFDKLLAYYNANLDGNGLMNWLITGFSGAKKTGAATDADLDVALAMCMAYKQWGDAKYQTGATTILGKIWDKEVGSNAFKPDDQGTGNLFNPSYFAVGAARVFAAVDKNHAWSTVADGCLSKLQTIQGKYSTGLVPDWVDGNNSAVDHNGSGTTSFGYDAVRTPWRVLLDYLWFGTATSKTFEQKIDTWIQGKVANASAIKIEYSIDGSTYNAGQNASYQGALTVPAMTNAIAADTTWLRMGSQSLMRLGDNLVSYYNVSWQVLYALTLSGNFQNLWGTVKSVNAVAPRSGDLSTWSATVRSDAVVLRGEGEVEASLVDATGRVLSQASGSSAVSLSRPATRGVYFVRVQGRGNGVFPVVLN